MIEDNILSIDTDKYLGKYMNPTTQTDDYELQAKKDYCNYVDTVDAETTNDPEEKNALLNERFEVMDRELTHVENWKKRCFVLTELQKFDMKECFETHYSLYERTLNNRLESPLPREKILCEMYNDLIYVDSVLYMDIDGKILDGKMISDYKKVAKYLSLIKFAQYLNEEIKKENEIVTPESEKLIKWIGKPSQLGYIMGQLAICGYIDAPQKKDGEINYSEFARQLSKVFSINSTENLAKELNPEKNSLGNNNREKIQIPHIKLIS